MPGFRVHYQLLELAQKLMSIESVMPSNHLILCRPLLLLPSVFPSIRGFSSESVFPIRGPKNWSFSFSISPSIEYSGLIFFRIYWLDLLAVQGTLKSLLPHHSLKASILPRPTFSITLNIPLTAPRPPPPPARGRVSVLLVLVGSAIMFYFSTHCFSFLAL